MNNVTEFWTHLGGTVEGGGSVGGSETGSREDCQESAGPLGGAGKISRPSFLTATSFSLAMVDVIFADVAQPDQTRIVALNAHTFLRNGGHFVISIKVRVLEESKYFLYH